jgi:hypothetical protein
VLEAAVAHQPSRTSARLGALLPVRYHAAADCARCRSGHCGGDCRCGQVDYLNSGGIGLLIMLLFRMHRQKQRLLAYGLSELDQHLFRITRLDQDIGVFDTESESLAAAGI